MLFIGRMPFLVTTLICAIVFCIAMILEHGFGIVGCALCKYERLIILVGGFCAFLSLFLPHRHYRIGFIITSLIFIGGFGLSLYHVLIQQGILPLPSFCRPPSVGSGMSIQDIRQQLLNTQFVPCNKITWSLFGLSLAAYNMMLTIGIAGYLLVAAKKASYEK